MKNLRITTAIVLVTVLLISSFTGCGNSESNTSGTTTSISSTVAESTPEAVKEPVILTAIACNDYYDAATKQVIDEYQKKTNNKIELQIVPNGQPFNDAISTKAAADDFPDLIYTYAASTILKTLTRADELLLDLSNESYIQKIVPAVLSASGFLKVDGKIYAIPAGGMNSIGVIYNKKIFSDNSIEIPKTYDAFLAVCETLKNKGITPVGDGVKDAWPPLYFQFVALGNELQPIAGLIDTINSGKMDFTKSPEYVKAIDRQRELKIKGYYNKDDASTGFDKMISDFGQQKTAMMVTSDAMIATVVSKFPDSASFISAFPLPWSDNPIIPIDMQRGLGVSKKSKNLEAAKGFLEYFTSEETLNSFYGVLKSIPSYTGVKAELAVGVSEMAEYVKNGKGKIMIQYEFKAGVDPIYNQVAVVLNAKDTPTILKELQEKYIKTGKDNKVEGF